MRKALVISVALAGCAHYGHPLPRTLEGMRLGEPIATLGEKLRPSAWKVVRSRRKFQGLSYRTVSASANRNPRLRRVDLRFWRGRLIWMEARYHDAGAQRGERWARRCDGNDVTAATRTRLGCVDPQRNTVLSIWRAGRRIRIFDLAALRQAGAFTYDRVEEIVARARGRLGEADRYPREGPPGPLPRSLEGVHLGDDLAYAVDSLRSRGWRVRTRRRRRRGVPYAVVRARNHRNRWVRGLRLRFHARQLFAIRVTYRQPIWERFRRFAWLCEGKPPIPGGRGFTACRDRLRTTAFKIDHAGRRADLVDLQRLVSAGIATRREVEGAVAGRPPPDKSGPPIRKPQ